MRRALLPLCIVAACTGADPDIAPSAPDAGNADASAEGGSQDGGAEAGPATFCSTRSGAEWCEDFDSILDLGALLPESSAETPKAALTQESFASAPRSVSFELADGKPAPQFTVLRKALVTDKDFRLEVDWRWAASNPIADQNLQSITIKNGGSQAQLSRLCGASDGGLPGCSYVVATCVGGRTPECRSYAIPPPAALAKWSRVALQVRFGQAGHVTYEEDAKVLVDVDDDIPVADATEPTSATIGLAVISGSSSFHEVLFDNFVVELR